MSVTLNIKNLARKILNCTEEEFIERRNFGKYKDSSKITKIRNTIMENLDFVFGNSAQVIKDKVTKKQMFNAVKRLMSPNASETIIYEFPQERSSKSGTKLINKWIVIQILIYYYYHNITYLVTEDASFNTTLDNTLPKELMAIEIEDLKSKNAAIQKELDALRPIHNLFKRVPSKTGRGGHYQISDELNSIGLRAMTHGCVSAKGLEVFCKILTDEFPVLLQPLSDEPAKFSLPSDSHFNNLRSDLDYICTKQSEEFVTNATTLFLTTDDTTTDRDSKSLHGTGLINELGEFHSYKNKVVLGSTADEKEKQILDVLTPTIISKFGGIVADTLYAQKKASRGVLAKIAEKTGRTDLPTEQNNCMLHLKNSKFKFMNAEIKSDDGKSLLADMSKNLEIVFASRKGTGFHRQSLRLDLESKLKQRNLRKPGIFFKSKIGSRIGVEFYNSVACVAYKDTILECLHEQIEHLNEVELKKTKSKRVPVEDRPNT